MTATSEPEVAQTTATVAPRGPFGLPALPWWQWWTLIGVAAVPLAQIRVFVFPTLATRMAIMVALTPLGCVALARSVRQRNVAAICGVAFVIAAAVSALAGDVPVLSLKGHLRTHASLLLFLSALGVWALGRAFDDAAKRLVGPALLLTALINSFVGVVQLGLHTTSGLLNTAVGRAVGLLGSPAYFSSMLSGAVAYALVRASVTGSRRWLGLVAAVSFGSALAGARATVLAVVAVSCAVLVVRRRQAVVPVAAVAAGQLFGVMYAQLAWGSSTASRVAAKGGDGRMEVWGYALDAWGDRPVLGVGFANSGAVVRERMSIEFVRAHLADDVASTWDDPHNIVVLLLVCTGAVGLLAVLAFVVAQLRDIADGALAAFVAACAVTWLVQPATVHSLLPAMLALGAACRPVGSGLPDRSADRPTSRWEASTVLAGVAAAAAFLLPLRMATAALDRRDPEAAARWSTWIWDEPALENAIAEQYVGVLVDDPSVRERALEYSDNAVVTEPNRALNWADHARRLLILDDMDAAGVALERAVDLHPTSGTVQVVQLKYARATQDRTAVAETLEVLCEIDESWCFGSEDG